MKKVFGMVTRSVSVSCLNILKIGHKTIEFLIKGLNPNNECKNEKMQPGRFTNTPTIEY